MALLGEVDELEVAGEGPGHLLGAHDRPAGDHGSGRRRIAVSRVDQRPPQTLDALEQLRAAVFGQHLAQPVAEHPHLPAQGHRGLLACTFPAHHLGVLSPLPSTDWRVAYRSGNGGSA
jgi:hypothetical protein